MVLTPVALLIAAAQTPGPSVDRSAEPELKRLFEAGSQLRGVHVLIQYSSRESSANAFYPDGEAEVWFASPIRYRVDLHSSWGSGRRVLCDGASLLIDPMDENQPVRLATPPKTAYEAHPDLKLRGDWVMPLLYVLSGKDGFEKLVDKEGPIRRESGGGVSFRSKDLGSVLAFFDAEGRLIRIDYDYLPFRKEQHEKYPQWVDEPVDPLNRQTITYLREGATFPISVFSTKPPKGAMVQDERTKKPQG